MPNRLAQGAAAHDMFQVETIMERLEFIQRETAQLYAKSKDTDAALALKALKYMENQLATAVRVREFILKREQSTPTPGEDIASILAKARKRLGEPASDDEQASHEEPPA